MYSHALYPPLLYRMYRLRGCNNLNFARLAGYRFFDVSRVLFFNFAVMRPLDLIFPPKCIYYVLVSLVLDTISADCILNTK